MSVCKHRDDIKKNGSKIYDPTAWKAIQKVEQEAQEKYDRTMEKIEEICEKAGYEIVDQIVLREKQSGRVWR